jgi:hypothetical protein
MSEKRGKGVAKTLFMTLLAVNLVFFIYARISIDARESSASHIGDLQINPDRVKLLNAGTRGAGGQAARAACLEWGPLAPLDAAKAEASLRLLDLPRPPMQRTLGAAGDETRVAYYVREPDAAVVAHVAELQRNFPGTQIKAGPCPD